MFEKLDFIEEKFESLGHKVADPEVIMDHSLWLKLSKEYSGLTVVVEKYREYKEILEGITESKEIIADGDDPEFVEMAKMELSELEGKVEGIEYELKMLLLPKDPNDDNNIIVELRAGAGGDEAGIFAAELMRLYVRYAESRRWKVDIMDYHETGVGGIKEASFMIKGKGAYSRLKFESGVHRVQRIPKTESGGRIHTSTATVAVLPEVEDVEIEINPNDIRVDVFRASGNGGQSVNTTDSAVRITHLPTGMVVSCQDGKSQMKNKDKALGVLKARLYDKELSEQNAEISEERKSQIGSGDRSAKIRTYNFPQGRITDHRIPLTLYKLDSYMNGDIDEMIDAIITHNQAILLKSLGEDN